MGVMRMSAESRCAVAKPSIPIAIEGHDVKIFTDNIEDNALEHMEYVYQQVQSIQVYEATLERDRDGRIARARQLSGLLRRYEELLDLKEREETISRVLDFGDSQDLSFQMLPFRADLQGRQMEQVRRRMGKTGNITEEEAFALLDKNVEELKKYLYFTSAKYIKKA